jgi:hypothetical protein
MASLNRVANGSGILDVKQTHTKTIGSASHQSAYQLLRPIDE